MERAKVAKLIQDKVHPPAAKSMFCEVDGPISCIEINKEGSLAVAAGRTVFKIYSVDEDRFTERLNLRSAPKQNLTYSTSDVAWSPHDENVLATASTNGSVVLWDLNKQSKSKQECVLTDHSRAVNRVCFSATEPALLLSCANDGYIKIIDSRRREEVACFLNNANVPVRDVQWSPTPYCFAAGTENGSIQIWDQRNPSLCLRDFPAHNGPVFAIDFHPEEKSWIASAGRDKLIKVWRLPVTPTTGVVTAGEKSVKREFSSSGFSAMPIHVIQCIAAVSRIRWRPKRPNQIASIAMNLDFGISVWDLRRPFIPFATFEEHKNVVTGILWKDPHVLLSGGKDCLLYLHAFKDSTRPAANAPPLALCVSSRGDINFAISEKTNSNAKMISQPKFQNIFKKAPDRTDEFVSNSASQCFFFYNPVLPNGSDLGFDYDWFVTCAEHYELKGKPIEELCAHNSRLAETCNKQELAFAWRMLGILSSMLHQSSGPTAISKPVYGHRLSSVMSKPPDLLHNSSHKDGADSTHEKVGETLATNEAISAGEAGPAALGRETTSGVSEEESDEMSGSLAASGYLHGGWNADLLYDEAGESDYAVFDFRNDDQLNDDAEEWVLPPEAFVATHALKSKFILHDLESGPAALADDDGMCSRNTKMVDDHTDEGIPYLSISTMPDVPLLDSRRSMSKILYYFSEQGDIQTAVSMLLVLGSRRMRAHVDESTQEQWLLSYIDLLHCFKLWTAATLIISLCEVGIGLVGQLNQQSTTMHTGCGCCGRAVPVSRPAGWRCERCRSSIGLCSLCQLPVKGRYLWCSGCMHGGHMDHMQEWFSRQAECPAGCGHTCTSS